MRYLGFTVYIYMTVLGILNGQTNTAPASVPAGAGDGPAFRTACWNGDLAEATRLLDAGAPLEGQDSNGRTPLLLSFHADNFDLVKLLLSRGANVNAIAFNGDSAVGLASQYGRLQGAQMLLAAGADFSKANAYGRTPLMLAAREGHDDVVALLIAQHADLNFANQRGDNAVAMAVWKDHPSIVKMLLDAGAKLPDANYTAPVLVMAATAGDLALVDLLLAQGVDVNAIPKDGDNALQTATSLGNVNIAARLLEKGAGVDMQNGAGVTALMLAKDVPCTTLLLQHHANLELKDAEGLTALMWAASKGNADKARALVENGSDINATDAQGETALTIAGDRGFPDIVDYLKGKGAKRTDVHIIPRGAPNMQLTQAQAWTLAVGAFYSQWNRYNPTVLGWGDKNPDRMKSMLQRDWAVKDRDSMLKQLDRLRDTGQRTPFQAEGTQFDAMTEAQFNQLLAAHPDDAAGLTAMRNSYRKWKERSGLAWDLCREANLINCGYSVGYLSQQEAWDRLFANAKIAQSSFGSWQEFSDNFLDGREIWAKTRSPQFDAFAQLLLNANDPNSPWTQNPWKTDLSRGDSPK